MATKFNHDKLKTLRQDKSLTLRELADKVQVEASTVSRWEAGISAPRPPHVRQLCRALRVTRQDLFIEVAIAQ